MAANYNEVDVDVESTIVTKTETAPSSPPEVSQAPAPEAAERQQLTTVDFLASFPANAAATVLEAPAATTVLEAPAAATVPEAPAAATVPEAPAAATVLEAPAAATVPEAPAAATVPEAPAAATVLEALAAATIPEVPAAATVLEAPAAATVLEAPAADAPNLELQLGLPPFHAASQNGEQEMNYNLLESNGADPTQPANPYDINSSENVLQHEHALEFFPVQNQWSILHYSIPSWSLYPHMAWAYPLCYPAYQYAYSGYLPLMLYDFPPAQYPTRGQYSGNQYQAVRNEAIPDSESLNETRMFDIEDLLRRYIEAHEDEAVPQVHQEAEGSGSDNI